MRIDQVSIIFFHPVSADTEDTESPRRLLHSYSMVCSHGRRLSVHLAYYVIKATRNSTLYESILCWRISLLPSLQKSRGAFTLIN